jgi:hypothetical protein
VFVTQAEVEAVVRLLNALLMFGFGTADSTLSDHARPVRRAV